MQKFKVGDIVRVGGWPDTRKYNGSIVKVVYVNDREWGHNGYEISVWDSLQHTVCFWGSEVDQKCELIQRNE